MWTRPLLLYINCLYSLSYLNSWVMLNWKIKDSIVWQRHFQDIIAPWQWQDYSSLLSSRSTVKEQKWRRKIRKTWSFRREVCKSEVLDKKSAKDKSPLITRETLLPAPAWTAGRLCWGQGPSTKTPTCEHANSLERRELKLEHHWSSSRLKQPSREAFP